MKYTLEKVLSYHRAGLNFLFFAMVLLVNGCAFLSGHEQAREPSEGEQRTKLRVTAPSVGNVLVVSNKACITPFFTNWKTIISGQRTFEKKTIYENRKIGIPLTKTIGAKQAEIYVPTNKKMPIYYSYEYRTHSSVSLCKIGGTFIPKIGVSYQADFSMRSGSCKLRVSKIITSKKGEVSTKAIKIEKINYCKASDIKGSHQF